MAHVILSASEILLFMAACYGWGSFVYILLYRKHEPSLWAYPTALGIASLIASGGLLNAFQIANPKVLFGLFIIGLGFAVFFVYQSVHGFRKNKSANTHLRKKFSYNITGNLIYLTLIVITLFFLVTVLMPARTFNVHDDFHIYLVWPLRMLQTGTLAGNPFDHLGVSSLGGQAFMQGMFLTFGHIADINAFDVILCQVLILVLLKELGEKIGANPIFVIAAGLLAIFINPHYANVSSLYSGSLMLLALTYASVDMTKLAGASSSRDMFRAAVPCGLFYAAVLALKSTFVFFVPVFWCVLLLWSLLYFKEKKKILYVNLACALFATLFLIPWISLYWESYLEKIHYILNGISYARDTTTSVEKNGNVLSDLFSNAELNYGNTFRDYLSIIGMLLLTSLATGWLIRKNKETHKYHLLIPLLTLLLSSFISYWLQFYFGPARLVVRYSCPILIAAAPAAFLVAGFLWTRGKTNQQDNKAAGKIALSLGVVLLVSQLGIIGFFSGTFVERIQTAFSHRTFFYFSLAKNTRYKKYNDYVLSRPAKEKMRHIQETVPAGQAIFTWTAMPLHFDFTRNPILSTNESGLAHNLLVMPLSEGVKSMRQFFNRFGVRYIIFEYRGEGMQAHKKLGSLQRSFIENLEGLIVQGNVLYNDGGIIVFDIGRNT
jgi:hypothetical protein